MPRFFLVDDNDMKRSRHKSMIRFRKPTAQNSTPYSKTKFARKGYSARLPFAQDTPKYKRHLVTCQNTSSVHRSTPDVTTPKPKFRTHSAKCLSRFGNSFQKSTPKPLALSMQRTELKNSLKKGDEAKNTLPTNNGQTQDSTPCKSSGVSNTSLTKQTNRLGLISTPKIESTVETLVKGHEPSKNTAINERFGSFVITNANVYSAGHVNANNSTNNNDNNSTTDDGDDDDTTIDIVAALSTSTSIEVAGDASSPIENKKHKKNAAFNEDSNFKSGDLIEARWHGGKKWYKGKILAPLKNKKYSILYDDGDSELNVRHSFIRHQCHVEVNAKRQRSYQDNGGNPTNASDFMGSRSKYSACTENPEFKCGDLIEARWHGRDKWYRGRILAPLKNRKYTVLYEDGDSELNVRRALIRYPVSHDGKKAASCSRKRKPLFSLSTTAVDVSQIPKTPKKNNDDNHFSVQQTHSNQVHQEENRHKATISHTGTNFRVHDVVQYTRGQECVIAKVVACTKSSNIQSETSHLFNTYTLFCENLKEHLLVSASMMRHTSNCMIENIAVTKNVVKKLANKNPSPSKISRFRGVSWNKRVNQWVAQIRFVSVFDSG